MYPFQRAMYRVSNVYFDFYFATFLFQMLEFSYFIQFKYQWGTIIIIVWFVLLLYQNICWIEQMVIFLEKPDTLNFHPCTITTTRPPMLPLCHCSTSSHSKQDHVGSTLLYFYCGCYDNIVQTGSNTHTFAIQSNLWFTRECIRIVFRQMICQFKVWPIHERFQVYRIKRIRPLLCGVHEQAAK